MSMISNILAKHGVKASLAQEDEFEQWAVTNMWDEYKKYKMDKRLITERQINDLGLVLPNGTVNKAYTAQLNIPAALVRDCSLEGCKELGLEVTQTGGADNICLELSGKPLKAGDYSVRLCYKYCDWKDGEEESVHELRVAFNADPRTLWKDLPTDPNIIFFKEDAAAEYVKVEETEETGPRKDMVAASKRGRSHAQEAKPRDDHFKLHHCAENGWYVMAVADGAGSARFSRKGSWIACDTVTEFCLDKLKDSTDLETKISNYNNAEDNTEEKAQAHKTLYHEVYNILANAAFSAHKAINDAASANKEQNAVPKDFATTLMFAISKKFDFGWFIASFWVGDGAMCVYNQPKQTFKLLGKPDEGEFSGQTRFLTMQEIFQDPSELMGRLRFQIEDDFTALMLMTDGVSDPMFETENNLNSIDKWNELWNKLQYGFPDDNIGGVDLTDDNEEAKDQLLNWLDFWSAGNHDDRTIALLY